ncbi:MAG TPA: RNA 2',3'-cyclic phosphodiesterase [Solirubrobacteraceae bacterium]
MSATAGTARLFVALELPGPVLTALGAWGETELPAVTGLRRVGRDALHVTLCFLGSRPAAEIPAIAGACSVLSGEPAAELSLSGLLWLPPRRPRVLAVGVEDGAGRLAGLQAMLSGALERGGWYEPGRRRFVAHVTVGRFGRTGGHAVPVADPPALRFPGRSVALLRSWPERGGSRYERLASVSLVRS